MSGSGIGGVGLSAGCGSAIPIASVLSVSGLVGLVGVSNRADLRASLVATLLG